jgi:DNA polymerase III sliding clamp (beta) subunit (PCNA family)
VTRHRDGAHTEVAVLTVDAGGTLRVGTGRPEPDARLRVGFNREFLLEAIAAGNGDQLVLELDGPIAPLAVRRPDDAETFSILMPTRLD